MYTYPEVAAPAPVGKDAKVPEEVEPIPTFEIG
jgi:hypothetical protein